MPNGFRFLRIPVSLQNIKLFIVPPSLILLQKTYSIHVEFSFNKLISPLWILKNLSNKNESKYLLEYDLAFSNNSIAHLCVIWAGSLTVCVRDASCKGNWR